MLLVVGSHHHTAANHDQPLAFSTLMAPSKCLHLARTLWSSERMTRNGQRGVNLALFFALWLAPAMNHLSIENARLSRVAVVSPSYESLRRCRSLGSHFSHGIDAVGTLRVFYV